jgi:hypothetical protein
MVVGAECKRRTNYTNARNGMYNKIQLKKENQKARTVRS